MIDTQTLDAQLDKWAARQHVAGYSACILGPEGIVYSRANGITDEAGTHHPDLDTMYGIASLSKSLTALCCCILACDGKLSLDDPVARYVPGFRMPGQPAEAVTIRHLATHTSGLPPMEVLEWSSAMNSHGRQAGEDILALRASAPNAMATIDQVLDYIASCPYAPVGAPGEHFSYSNEGYAVLSYVVDAAAGMPLEAYMTERIFRPLGMTRSILDNGVEASRQLSGGNFTSLFSWEDGHQVCDDGWTILPPFRGCAMVKSTARDLAAYYRALSNHGMHEGRQVIPREAVELLLGASHPLSRIPVMCMGINKRAYRGHVICDHGGALHGVSAKGAMLLGEGYGFALLTNESGAGLDSAVWSMENAVLGRPLSESHEWFVPSGHPFSAPDMICGTYEGNEGLPSLLEIRMDGELCAFQDGERLTLRHCGETRFMALEADGSLSSRLIFHIRGGLAWGVSVGTRIFARKTE